MQTINIYVDQKKDSRKGIGSSVRPFKSTKQAMGFINTISEAAKVNIFIIGSYTHRGWRPLFVFRDGLYYNFRGGGDITIKTGVWGNIVLFFFRVVKWFKQKKKRRTVMEMQDFSLLDKKTVKW